VNLLSLVTLMGLGLWFAVGLYLVLFFAVLHLVDSLAAKRPAGAEPAASEDS